jgi:peptide/nickel transport system permease protein
VTYIIRRSLQALLVLIIVSLLVFFIMRLLPGDPLVLYSAQGVDLQSLSPERIAALRHEFGLDKPLVVQYLSWVGGIFRGDMGTSIYYHEKVSTLILDRFPVTVWLGLLALVLSSVLGILSGLVAGVRRGKWIDKIITPLTYIGVTIPVFWLGILLIYAIGYKLQWLPIQGFTSPFSNFWMCIQQTIMPVFCLSVFNIAANARQMRSSMLEVIRQDYIRTAWAKGLTERIIIQRHAIKNGLIPVITLMGTSIGFIFGGSVLVETVFAIPGIGRLLTSSILGHDYVVVQSITFLIAAIVLLANLAVDLSYAWFDPRIRYK